MIEEDLWRCVVKKDGVILTDEMIPLEDSQKLRKGLVLDYGTVVELRFCWDDDDQSYTTIIVE